MPAGLLDPARNPGPTWLACKEPTSVSSLVLYSPGQRLQAAFTPSLHICGAKDFTAISLEMWARALWMGLPGPSGPFHKANARPARMMLHCNRPGTDPDSSF